MWIFGQTVTVYLGYLRIRRTGGEAEIKGRCGVKEECFDKDDNDDPQLHSCN